jgi:hypothetical protein
MPTKRVTMRRIKEALRLHLQAGLSYDEGNSPTSTVAAGLVGQTPTSGRSNSKATRHF